MAQAATQICICSGARGQFFCIECGQYFCQTCRISHMKANVSKNHKLVESFKTTHKDCEMCLTKYGGQFYCSDCSQYFCSNCKMIHLRANVSKNHIFRDSSDLERTETSKHRNLETELLKQTRGKLMTTKISHAHDDKKTEKYSRETVRDRLISEITNTEIAHLKSIEDNYSVRMKIDRKNCVITLDGTIDVIMNAKQDVLDVFRKFAHTKFCEAEAEIIREQVQWYRKGIDDKDLPTLIEYPDLTNMYLETAHNGESGRTKVEYKDHEGEEYIIVIKDMKAYLKKDRTIRFDVLRREKIQGDGYSFKHPQEWEEQGSADVKLVTLVNSSREYKYVEQKFIKAVFSGRPEWANQFNKHTFMVTQIQRVQTVSLYYMYTAKKALIDKQNPQDTNNETELWHGTPESAVQSINYFGFNRSYCNANSKDANWGDGVYFAADASYAAKAWLSKATASREHNIYLCKVLTGVHCKGQKDMRRLPVRQDGTLLSYDSATDNNYKPAVEYVIFNDSQAYPQYCIKFKY